MPTVRRRPPSVSAVTDWRTARRFRVGMEDKGWCDGWHAHLIDAAPDLDWLGRRRAIRALLHALARARRELRGWQGPVQLFAVIDPDCLSESAIYVHTQNPNGSAYPMAFGVVRALAVLPPVLAGRVDLGFYRVFECWSDDGGRSFIVEAC